MTELADARNRVTHLRMARSRVGLCSWYIQEQDVSPQLQPWDCVHAAQAAASAVPRRILAVARIGAQKLWRTLSQSLKLGGQGGRGEVKVEAGGGWVEEVRSASVG